MAILFLLTGYHLTFSQTESLNLRHINQAKGLPNNHITSLFKDSRGFLWIGSAAGLYRYDGYTTRFAVDIVGRRTDVLSEQILSVQEDAIGRLWVQSESSYAIYDPETNALKDWISDYIKEFGISGYITAVVSDENGDIWVVSQQEGLYRIKVKEAKAEKAIENSTPDKSIRFLTITKGKIYGVTNSGAILEIDPQSMAIRSIAKNPGNFEGESTIHNVFVDKTNKLWITTYHHTYLFDLESESWQTARLPNEGNLGIVKNIYNDSNGTLWIARDHQGIEKIEFEDGKYKICPMATEGDFIPQSTVSAILEDEDGSLLFGTYKLGLYSYNENVSKFHVEGFPGQEKIPDVNCMVTIPDGTVLVGTDNSGLWNWNPSSKERVRIEDMSEGSPYAITSLAFSPKFGVFIGKFARGLFSYKDGKVVATETGTEIDHSYVWSMDFDRNANLWIGTLGNGVFKYDPKTKTAEHFSTTNTELTSDFITSILPSKDGNIYIGTSGGVCRYNPKDKQLKKINIDKEKIISNSKVIQIYEDSRGLIWISTTSGLKAMDSKNGEIYDIRIGTSLYTSDVFGMIEDNMGGMWISNGSSLTNLKVAYNPVTAKLEVSQKEYDHQSGLPECDFNQRSFVKLNDGSIAVGNPLGIIHFSPNDLPVNVSKPKVMFSDLYMDNKPVIPGEEIDGRIALKKAIFSGERVEFNHNPKEFTIYFTSDNYALPEKTRFKYRLKGYSDQWTECAEGINYVTYTNLSSGNYQLQVVAINEDGYESDYPATLDIKIYPSFWGTPWGWLIYALMGALLIWIIIKLARERERRLFKENSQKEYQKKQEELNQLKFKFFTNVSHDLRTPLTLIVSPLEDMIKESTDTKQTKRLTQMRNNAMRLLSLVNQLLDFRKTEEADLHLHPSEGDIVGFARNVCTSFASLSERKDINMTFYSDQECIELLFDEDKMEKIFMNLLGNAFKFTPAGGRIDIAIDHCGEDRSKLRIQVADTGSGITDKDKKHIFDRFFQSDNDGKSYAATGSGIGLSMVSEYVKLHDGTIRVADNVERGSVFIIEIPIRHRETGNSTISTEKPTEVKDLIDSHESNESERKDNRKTVLIVDDSRDMTEMLKDSLDSLYNVMTVSDGKEALKKIAKSNPDIILTDLMMPNMNGMELCRELKKNKDTVNIPIIILTAKHDLGVKLEGLTLGADDYITKPFNLDVLRLRMSRLIELNSKGARRSLIEPEPDEIKITSLDEQLIEKAMKYVSQNISNPELSVEGLSEYLSMSRVNLYKKMKQITGKSPIEFIRIIRLKRAAQLLRESQLNISEIAYKTGFNNPKMFSKYFKEEFGILPSAYQTNETKETKASFPNF